MTTLERTMTVAQHIASLVVARHNCIASGNAEWQGKHEARLTWIERNILPSGSGIDNGTTIDWNKSNSDKLVFSTAYHHMNDGGYYDGWTDHVVTAQASFVGGIDIQVSGRDRNEIKDYLADAFFIALNAQLTENAEGYYWPNAATA